MVSIDRLLYCEIIKQLFPNDKDVFIALKRVGYNLYPSSLTLKKPLFFNLRVLGSVENRLNSIWQPTEAFHSQEFVRPWNLISVPPNASLWITFQKNPHLWALCRLGVILVVFSVPILQRQRIQRTNLLPNYSLSGSATSQEAGSWRGRRENTRKTRMQLHLVTSWLNCFRLLSLVYSFFFLLKTYNSGLNPISPC